MERLCDPDPPRKTSRNFRRRTGGPPRSKRCEVKPKVEAKTPRSMTSVEDGEPADIGSPIVVHRHYHHHYHHHYAVSDLEDVEATLTSRSCDESVAVPATSPELDARGEIEHHHRHHHVMEVEMGVRARQLLEDALEAQSKSHGPKPSAGPSDGTNPDPRLPRLLGGNKNSNCQAALEALDDIPQNIVDIVDAGRTGLQVARTQRAAPNDFRPNRMIKGSTRTSRVVQRSCAFNTTKNRDEVMQGRHFSAVEQQKNEWLRKVAAERIQRTWRAWYKYCQDNSEWLMTTWIAATMIQARWRTYHMRRKKLDQACTNVQRIARAFLVRRTLQKRKASIVIQRRARGVLARNRIRRMHSAAVKCQALIRGGIARRSVAKRRVVMNQLAP
eukprot:symbB.v1.2.011191.t1/scaffold714.1/size170141/8